MGVLRASRLIPLALFAAALVVIAPWSNFPLNDDWVYARNAVASAEAGRLEITFPQFAWAIPQTIIGALVGASAKELHSELRWVGILSLIISWALLFRIAPIERGDRIHDTSVATATLFLTPLFLVSLSFMSDTPFLACWIASMSAWMAWSRRPTPVRLLVAIAVSSACLAQRQFGLLIPAAMGVVLTLEFLRGRTRRAAFRMLAPVPTLAVYALLHSWWKDHAPLASAPLDLTLSPVYVLGTAFASLSHLGMLGLPWIAAPLSPKSRKILSDRRFQVLFGGFVLYSLGHQLRSGSAFPYLSNQMSRFGFFGANEILYGDRLPIFGLPLEMVLTVVSLAGALRLALGCLVWIREPGKSRADQLVLVSGLAYFALSCFRATFFDRYALPLLPFALYCLTRSADSSQIHRPARIAGAAATAGLVLLSTTLVHDYFRWNESRWEAARFAVASGWPSKQIGAGYEYFGEVDASGAAPSKDPRSYPVVVSFSRLPGFESIREFPYQSAWHPRGASIHLLKRLD